MKGKLSFHVRKDYIEVGAQHDRVPRYFVFAFVKHPCSKQGDEHSSSCSVCGGTGYTPIDGTTLDGIDAKYHVWTDVDGRWRWSMTMTQYPYDEVGIGSHGAGRSLNTCVRACIRHYTEDIVGLGRDK